MKTISIAEIRKLRKDGLSQAAIASRLGIPAHSVTYALKKGKDVKYRSRNGKAKKPVGKVDALRQAIDQLAAAMQSDGKIVSVAVVGNRALITREKSEEIRL